MERFSKGYVSHFTTRRIGETAVEHSTARSQRVGDAGCSTPAFKKGKRLDGVDKCGTMPWTKTATDSKLYMLQRSRSK